MLLTRPTQKQLQRYSRWLVIVFTVSWVNLAFQLPAHAAMMQMPVQSTTMQMDMDSMDCECPPSICDLVLATDNQSIDGVNFINLASLDFNVIYVSDVSNDSLSLISNHHLLHSDMVFRDTSPPPILFNTVLLI